MPEMSGVELALAVRARCPNLPVVIITGYVDIGDLDRRIERAIVLRKPFRMNELGATMERAMRYTAPTVKALKTPRHRPA
jgi:FixJ family two-component response regulator